MHAKGRESPMLGEAESVTSARHRFSTLWMTGLSELRPDE